MTDIPNFNLPWLKVNLIVLDLEGTGSQHKDKEGIVEIAAIQISHGQLTSNYYYKLLNPEIEIPSFISRIHGFKNKDLEKEPIFDAFRIELLEFLNNKILVGHSVNVDYRLLKLKMPNYFPSLILDIKKLSKHFWNNELKHGLDDLIVRFQIQNTLTDLPIKRKRHSAYYDAYATGIIFVRMLQEKFTEDTSLKQIAELCSVYPEITKSNQNSLFQDDQK